MKGITQTFEAIISILMILTVFLVIFSSRSTLPEYRAADLKLKGYSSLKSLDEINQLRMYALTNDTQTIEEELQSLLPPASNFEVHICNMTCENPNINSENLVSVSYLVAGNESNFSPKEIVLYMW